MTARSRFVGREDDLARLVDVATHARVVTVVGPGGVGKTRLVLQAIPAIRTALGATVHHLSLVGLQAGASVAQLCSHLGTASAEALAVSLGADPSLVIVDNCELVTVSAAAFVDALLAASDSTRVITTSREPLAIGGERVFVLEPLSDAPAVALFLDRAAASGAPREVAHAALGDVAEVCRQLDGLPLAIELAAARSRMFTPSELLALMDRRLELLRGRGNGSRHHSIRETIEESADLLEGDARRLLRQVSVFSGAFDARLAHEVFGTGSLVETLDLLTALVDRSLVVAEPRATTRYRLLELIREFADDELRAADEWVEARERLTDVMVSAADTIVAAGLRRWSADVLRQVAALTSDLIAAIDWCIAHDGVPDRALRLYLPLFAAVHQSRSTDVRAAGERLLDRWAAPAPLRAEAMAIVATGYAMASEPATARRIAADAASDPRVTALGRVLARGVAVLAAHSEGDIGTALADAAAAAAEARAAGFDPFARSLAAFEALALEANGDFAGAEQLAHALAEESDVAHDPVTEVWSRLVAATIAGRAGRWGEVRRLVERAQSTSLGLTDGWWNGAIFRSRAYCAAYEAASTAMIDGWDASVELWAAVIERAARGGELAELAITLRVASGVADRLGQSSAAMAFAAAVPPTAELAVLPPLLPEPDPPASLGNPAHIVAAVEAALAACTVAAGEATVDNVVSDGAGGNVITHSGETWTVTFGGVIAHVRDLKGIANLAALLAEPHHDVHCLELMGAADVGDGSGPLIDATAKREYRERILELQADIDDARDANDPARAERAEAELDALVEQLSDAFGLGGRSRVAGSSSQRARSAATYRLRAAIKTIAAVHPALGRHLGNSVRTGTWCSYRPETDVQWRVLTM